MSRPLLLACTSLYPGPWVPTNGLKGVISADGLIRGQDEVKIWIRDITESEEDTILTIDQDMTVRIDLTKSMIRAERTKSSGNEIFVWLN